MYSTVHKHLLVDGLDCAGNQKSDNKKCLFVTSTPFPQGAPRCTTPVRFYAHPRVESMQTLARSPTSSSSVARGAAAAGRRAELRRTSAVCPAHTHTTASGARQRVTTTKSRRDVRAAAAEQERFNLFNLEDVAKPFISAKKTLNEGMERYPCAAGEGSYYGTHVFFSFLFLFSFLCTSPPASQSAKTAHEPVFIPPTKNVPPHASRTLSRPRVGERIVAP